jgi:predicted outer membrane lipoprotein
VTLLHLPYTAWHLSYVAIGAALSGTLDGVRLLATLAAFMLAVGIAAHCLDELHGRPLRTQVPSRVLVVLAAVALIGSAVIGLIGARVVGPSLIPWVVIGVVLVPAYDLEWGGRIVHNDIGFALGWGAFPVVVGAAAQEGVNLAVLLAAAFAVLTSLAQRRLSTSVRAMRRRAAAVEGEITWRDGTRTRLDLRMLTGPAEAALLLLAGAHVLLAGALVAGAV